jgi:hypothetical protein
MLGGVEDVQHALGVGQDLVGEVPDPFGAVGLHGRVAGGRHSQAIGLASDPPGELARLIE